MDNYVKMDACFCTRTIWFQLAVVAVVLYFVYQMIVFLRRSCFPLRSIKRRKRSSAKNKRAHTNPIISGAPVAYNPRSFLEDYKPSRVGPPRRFTFQSLVNATQDFQFEREMYSDGLGDVYKGERVHWFRPNEVFAIRRLHSISEQSREDFLQDVRLLNKAHHPNLAQLIGYSDGMNRALVYKYVPGGTLEHHLYGNQLCLDWNLRLKIALGVARAVEYLQNIMKPSIYHFFITPSNIWLDENYTPKLSACGIVSMYPFYMTIEIRSYALLDCMINKNQTLQTDIYGFGVLLLHIITGKKFLFKEEGVAYKLTDWVQPYLKDKENSSKMVDPMLDGKFDHEEFYECCSIAESCIKKEPNSRPLIADLVARMNRLVTRD